MHTFKLCRKGGEERRGTLSVEELIRRRCPVHAWPEVCHSDVEDLSIPPHMLKRGVGGMSLSQLLMLTYNQCLACILSIVGSYMPSFQ